jgi:hypothetical protein
LYYIFPVVSLADSLNHRLRCWHPFGDLCKRGRFLHD